MSGRTASPIDRLLPLLSEAKQTGERTWRARCPAHQDRNPSLDVRVGDDDTVLLQCRSQRCTAEAICVAVGLTLSDLFPTGSHRGNGRIAPSKPKRRYATIDDVVGALLRSSELHGGKDTRFRYADTFWMIRFDFDDDRPKTFRPLNCVEGEWAIGDPTGRLPLYRIEEAAKHGTVFVVEGEGVADKVWSIGLPAVTSAHGSSSPQNSDWEPLANKNVIILPDNDAPGQKYGATVASILTRMGCTVRIVELPGLGEGEDIVNFIESRDSRTAGELRDMIEEIVCKTPACNLEQKTEPAHVTPAANAWPEPMDEAAYHGLAGEIVRAIEPHSEADPVGLLIQILVSFGNVIGRGAYFMADGASHHMNLFAVLIGETSKARKGTSWSRIFRLFEDAESEWANERVASGLSSGEGLIWAVRDPIFKKERDKKTKEINDILVDAGVEDKRILVHEPEFASVLRVAQREGCTLSPLLRLAWERGNLRTMTKNSPAVATGAHVSIVGHIVGDELRRYLDRSEIAGGLANRFIWLCVRRSKCLPEGGSLGRVNFTSILDRLGKAIHFGRMERELYRDDAARRIWKAVYPTLSDGKPGLAGAIIARGEAQTMRLAAIYALLDCSPAIRPEHLNASLALWEFAEQSVFHVFGRALGDPVADEIHAALSINPDGLTRTQISALFQRNVSKDRLGRALVLLHRSKLAEPKSIKTSGRPAEVWFAIA